LRAGLSAFIRQTSFDNHVYHLGFAQENKPELPEVFGVNDRLDFSNGFGVVLNDVMKRAAWPPYHTARLDQRRTIVLMLDDLQHGTAKGDIVENFDPEIVPLKEVNLFVNIQGSG
jgi:hypothetical protein